jgi:hypothetical protein
MSDYDDDGSLPDRVEAAREFLARLDSFQPIYVAWVIRPVRPIGLSGGSDETGV